MGSGCCFAGSSTWVPRRNCSLVLACSLGRWILGGWGCRRRILSGGERGGSRGLDPLWQSSL